MPTLKTLTARRLAKPGADYASVWRITEPANIRTDNQGLYSYVGKGDRSEEDIGTVRTLLPLDPRCNGGISSFEITIADTGTFICHDICSTIHCILKCVPRVEMKD